MQPAKLMGTRASFNGADFHLFPADLDIAMEYDDSQWGCSVPQPYRKMEESLDECKASFYHFNHHSSSHSVPSDYWDLGMVITECCAYAYDHV